MAKKAVSRKSAVTKPHLRLVEDATPPDPPRRKLIAFDPDTFAALDIYRRDSMKDWEELAEEAFRDLLNKHGRSADLRTALKRSAKREESNGAASGTRSVSKKSPQRRRK